MKKLFLFIIRFYQTAISAYTPAHCRYYPTCSSYAYTAISRFGVWRGGLLAILRIFRCHPFHPGGYDPVPEEWDLHYYKKQNSAGAGRKEVSPSRDQEEHRTCS